MGTDHDHVPDEVIEAGLQRAAWDKRRAAKEYRTLIEQAHAQGWGHTRIARVCGVSEAAIRNMLRRKPTGKKGGRRVRTR